MSEWTAFLAIVFVMLAVDWLCSQSLREGTEEYERAYRAQLRRNLESITRYRRKS